MPTINKDKQTLIAIDKDTRQLLNELKQLLPNGRRETYDNVIRTLLRDHDTIQSSRIA